MIFKYSAIMKSNPETILTVLSEIERQRDMEIHNDHNNFIALSLLNQWMKDVAAPAAGGILLDYGCGGQPYRALVSRYVTEYLGADVAPAKDVQLDIVFRSEEPLALPSQSVDTVLSTQVLEHVPDPQAYLRECRRLLRRGGRLIISVPMQWRHHEDPYDFLRFTRYGIVHMLQENHFDILDLRPCGGAFALLGQILVNTLNAQGLRNKFVIRIINRVSLALDRRYPDYGDTLGWMCIASAK